MKIFALKILSKIALLVTFISVNTTCVWLTHQPAVPTEARKFKKY
ncbi:cyclic lactone autoinducer peptide [Mycoplasmatota bacterium WC44]